MTLQVDVERLLLAQKAVRAELLAERAAAGHWTGHLASSPFATAAAVSALVMAHRSDTKAILRHSGVNNAEQVAEQVVQSDLCEFLLESVHWLAENQNPDGGWGDCTRGQSNLPATFMVQAAFRLTGVPANYDDLMFRSDQFVEAHGGIAALRRELRFDRPMVAAILTNCALAGIVPWRQVPALPFELACLPASWQKHVQLSVHRLALPLVLAIGQVKFHHDPPRNPIAKLWRGGTRKKSLAKLEALQAADDSFLTSVPITAFVVLSLSSMGSQNHAIVQRGVEYLLSSVRGDSSWPARTNLSTTVTSLAIESLAAKEPDDGLRWPDTAVADETATERGPNDSTAHDSVNSDRLASSESSWNNEQAIEWLLSCQRTAPDMLTGAAPGGWAWSDAAGALPNASDTACALIALSIGATRSGALQNERVDRAVRLGVSWLLDLQNEDGGWPTFYKQSGGFQADPSATEVTPRVLRALALWQKKWRDVSRANSQSNVPPLEDRVQAAIETGWRYLESVQRDDGSFVPSWFGNECQPDDQNLVLGTSEVLVACSELGKSDSDLATGAARWLLGVQHTGGGWGPPRARVDYSGTDNDGFRAWRSNEAMAKSSSLEETSAAVRALLPLVGSNPLASKAVSAGLTWVVNAIELDAQRRPAVIGFYPSKIWYHERLYPLVFTAGALERATQRLSVERMAAAPVS